MVTCVWEGCEWSWDFKSEEWKLGKKPYGYLPESTPPYKVTKSAMRKLS